MSSLDSVWDYREETLYPQLFGKVGRGFFNLHEEDFTRLAPGEVNPRWLQLGVVEFEPSATRKSWLYVTSGGSTPWDTDPAEYKRDEFSWLGVEYVIEAPEQADWPINILHWLLAMHVLAGHRRLGELAPPDYGNIIPLGTTIDGSDSLLTQLALCLPTHYPSQGQLDSGKFDFLHVLGLTELEASYAQSLGTARLVQKLAERGAAPVSDPRRAQVAL